MPFEIIDVSDDVSEGMNEQRLFFSGSAKRFRGTFDFDDVGMEVTQDVTVYAFVSLIATQLPLSPLLSSTVFPQARPVFPAVVLGGLLLFSPLPSTFDLALVLESQLETATDNTGHTRVSLSFLLANLN